MSNTSSGINSFTGVLVPSIQDFNIVSYNLICDCCQLHIHFRYLIQAENELDCNWEFRLGSESGDRGWIAWLQRTLWVSMWKRMKCSQCKRSFYFILLFLGLEVPGSAPTRVSLVQALGWSGMISSNPPASPLSTWKEIRSILFGKGKGQALAEGRPRIGILCRCSRLNSLVQTNRLTDNTVSHDILSRVRQHECKI